MSYLEYVAADHNAEDPMPELARANKFTMKDLEQNRRGRISDDQMSRLFLRALYPIRYPAMALLGWLTCCFIVKTLVPGFMIKLAVIFGLKGIGVIFGLITAVTVLALLGALLLGGRNVFLLIQDLSTGVASHLDGRVTASREETAGLGMDRFREEKRTRCWYVVQNQYFEVDRDAAEALPYNSKLRLYFTPRSKLLLSIEPVPSN